MVSFIIGAVIGGIIGGSIGGPIFAVVGAVFGGLMLLGTISKQNQDEQHKKEVETLLKKISDNKEDE